MLNLENIKYYRKGHVIKETLDNLYCCHIAEVTKPVFEYIELYYEDGSRKFVYEDTENYNVFRTNFHKVRFTSFHEFFCTEEIGVEDRGFAQFNYYVYRPETDYIIESLENALSELRDINEVEPRITYYNQYDNTIDYHLPA